MLGNLYHKIKKLPEKFTNKTKNMANEAYAEAQYCKDKINFNRKLAELTSSGSNVFSLQTLKQSYNMTKEYRRLKEEGKKYKLCSNRSALSWKTAMAGSLFKRLTIGS
uniref:Uncharacterized protein n=1 Tax=Romanomermis culicivorax TaxID=13658 RepID=A0A915JGT1_ROMCU